MVLNKYTNLKCLWCKIRSGCLRVSSKNRRTKNRLEEFLGHSTVRRYLKDIAKWALVTLHTERLQPLLQSSLLDKLRVFWNYGQTLGISFSLEEKSKLGRRQSHGKRSLEAVWLDVQLQQMKKSAKENITSVLSNISANQTNSSKNCHFNKKKLPGWDLFPIAEVIDPFCTDSTKQQLYLWSMLPFKWKFKTAFKRSIKTGVYLITRNRVAVQMLFKRSGNEI